MRESDDSLQRTTPPRCIASEVEPHSKLQLPHRCAVFNVRDLPIVPALAIDAAVGPVVCAKGIDRMVEDVEGVHTELGTQLFCDRESLHYRHIGVEPSWSMECVPAKISERAATGQSKRSRTRSTQGTYVCANGQGIRIQNRRYRSEESKSVSGRVDISRDTYVE